MAPPPPRSSDASRLIFRSTETVRRFTIGDVSAACCVARKRLDEASMAAACFEDDEAAATSTAEVEAVVWSSLLMSVSMLELRAWASTTD